MSKYKGENVSGENPTDPILAAVIAVTVVIILLVLNMHYARELGVFKWLKARRKKIAVLLLWSLCVAGISVKSYWYIYVTHPRLWPTQYSETGIVYKELAGDDTPYLNGWDFALIFASSLLVGAVLFDIGTIVYGYIMQSILSSAFTVTWSSFFIWHSLGYGKVYSLIDFGIGVQFIIYYAVKNVFRMMFPLAFLLCFLGVFLGAFIRAYVQPSAEPI